MTKMKRFAIVLVAGAAIAIFFSSRDGTDEWAIETADAIGLRPAMEAADEWFKDSGIGDAAASARNSGRDWLAHAGSAFATARTEPDQPGYRFAETLRGDVLSTVAATGSLTPVATVVVGTEVSGQVKELYADFNDEVRRGEAIALIDPISFEIAVDQAQADLDVARAAVATQMSSIEGMLAALETARFDYQAARANTEGARVRAEEAAGESRRKKALGKSASDVERERAEAAHQAALANVRSMEALEGAKDSQVTLVQAEVRAARSQLVNFRAVVRQRDAALRHAEIELERTIIRSPVSGVVVQRNIEVGQTVAASLQSPTLFTIAQDLRDMQVNAAIDESEIGRIEPGQRVEFTVDAFPNRRFDGTVAQIRKSPQVSQNVVTYTVVVKARNPDLLLLPGMTASARFIVAESTSVAKVPNAALRFRPPELAAPHGSHVWVEDRGMLRPIKVRIGLTDGSHTEVAGDEIEEGLPVVTGIERPRQEQSTAKRLIGIF